LAGRLAEPGGPEVVLILTGRAPSWFDRMTMDPARKPLLHRLAEADRQDRFRAFAPMTSTGEGIVVHSKVSVFDDRIALVGSANLNNRSEGFDTECEIAIEASDERTRREIAQLRDVLLAHYLATPEAAFVKARRTHGALIPTIDALNGPGRLKPIATRRGGWWDQFTSQHRLGDPGGVEESWRLFKGQRRFT
jgi:phosphatidylserine/phosphatidylglycerophosphate/cardiolipin synthase-like enzyme